MDRSNESVDFCILSVTSSTSSGRPKQRTNNMCAKTVHKHHVSKYTALVATSTVSTQLGEILQNTEQNKKQIRKATRKAREKEAK